VTRVLIVDDEAPARALLHEILSAEPDVEILGEATTGLEAVKAATELKPEVVFLDIEMPKLDGFEVLELLDPQVAVVFVTAYDNHALRAFEVHAVDYVLKPYRAERIRGALARARTRIAARPDPTLLAREARPPGRYAQRVVVKEGAQIHVIPIERLDYAQAQDDYIALHSGGKTLLKTQTMGSLESSLDPSLFVRVHRSFLVRLDRIRTVEPSGKNDHLAILADGTRVPVSREGYARLRELLR